MLDSLPNELINEIIKFTDPDETFFLIFVSKKLKIFFDEYKIFKLKNKKLKKIIFKNIKNLFWFENNLDFKPQVFNCLKYALKHGENDKMKLELADYLFYLYDDYALNFNVFDKAIQYNNTPYLKWLYEKNCPIDYMSSFFHLEDGNWLQKEIFKVEYVSFWKKMINTYEDDYIIDKIYWFEKYIEPACVIGFDNYFCNLITVVIKQNRFNLFNKIYVFFFERLILEKEEYQVFMLKICIQFNNLRIFTQILEYMSGKNLNRYNYEWLKEILHTYNDCSKNFEEVFENFMKKNYFCN
jgi:hypothetical protein